MPIQKACITTYVNRKLPSRVPTVFDVRSHARLDFIEDFNEIFEKCTYDCRTQDIEDKIRGIDLPEKPGKAHVVFSKNNKSLADRFDKAYQEIDGDKIYLELLKTYIDVNQL